MSDTPFYLTGKGRKFFDGDIPRLIEAAEKIGNSLEKIVAVDEEFENTKTMKDILLKIVQSADDTGCSGDLTVVSREAVEEARQLIKGEPA